MESLVVSWICLLMFSSIAGFPLEQYGYEPPYAPGGGSPAGSDLQSGGALVNLQYEPPAPYQHPEVAPQQASSSLKAPSEPSPRGYKPNGFIVGSDSASGPLVDLNQDVGYEVYSGPPAGRPRSGGSPVVNLHYEPHALYQQEVPQRSSTSPSEPSSQIYEPNGFIVDPISGPRTVGPLVDPTRGVEFGVFSGPPAGVTPRFSGQPRSGGYGPPAPYQQPEGVPQRSSSGPEGPSEPLSQSYESRGFIVDPTSGPGTVGPLVDPTRGVEYGFFSGPSVRKTPSVSGQPRSGGYGPPAPYQQPEEIPQRSLSSPEGPSEPLSQSYESSGFIVDPTRGPGTVGPLVDPTRGVEYGVFSGPSVRKTPSVSGQPRSGGYGPPAPYQQPEEVPKRSSSGPEGPNEPLSQSYESSGFIVDPTRGPGTVGPLVDPTQEAGYEVFSGPPAGQPRSGGPPVAPDLQYGPPAPYRPPEQGAPAGYSVYSGHAPYGEAPVALINLQPVSVVSAGGNSTAGHGFTTSSQGGGSDPAAEGPNTAAPAGFGSYDGAPGAAPEPYKYFQPPGSGQLEGSQPAGGDDSSFYDPTYEPNSFVAPGPSGSGSGTAFRWVTMPAEAAGGFPEPYSFVPDPEPSNAYGPGLPWVAEPAGGAASLGYDPTIPLYDTGSGLPWDAELAKGGQDEPEMPQSYFTKTIGDFQRVYELTSHTSYDPDLYLEVEVESDGGTKV